MRNARGALVLLPSFLASLLVVSSQARAADNILYVQGRAQGSWDKNVAALSGTSFVNRTLTFNGNTRIASAETDSTTNPNSVNYAIRQYCSAGNSCIIHCYSTGCYRVKKAIDNIRNGVGGAADSLAGLLYIEASGDASGGTDIAEIATEGFTGWIAKLFGQQEAVDFDLTRSMARSTYSYIHDQVGVNMWHLAGNRDVCKKLLGLFKICGSGSIEGSDDGVIPWASSAGYSTQQARTSLCNASAADEQDTSKNVANKYPWHRVDTKVENCSGFDVSGTSWDHFGMVQAGTAALDSDIHDSNALYNHYFWSDATNEAMCGGASCDKGFFNANNNDWTKKADGTPTGALSVDAYTSQAWGQTGSQTSCAGRCGSNPGGGFCRCDAACVAAGSCCADYSAVKCTYVNQ